jgi:hypothetical protein
MPVIFLGFFGVFFRGVFRWSVGAAAARQFLSCAIARASSSSLFFIARARPSKSASSSALTLPSRSTRCSALPNEANA